MPTYDYECPDCGKRFTVKTSISEHEKEKPKCPKCGSTKTKAVPEPFFAVTSKKS
ncbi:MAG TPA: zinc ribbon domain-containing protein [Chthoniobacterales bacterium]